MGRERHWTEKEINYLKEKWGVLSMKTLSKKLNRTIPAIRNRAVRLKLGSHLLGDGHITVRNLIELIGQKCNITCYLRKFEKNNCPIKKKLIIEKRIRVIYIDEFWEWAYKNRNILDFSRFPYGNLGPEPKWVDIKRRADRRKKATYKASPWTKEEDKRLLFLLRQHKYTRRDLAKKFNRTQGAIEKRMHDLKLIERPVAENNHIKWTKEEFDLLVELLKDGYDYEVISEIMDKSSKGIRNRVYSMYLTENSDKVLSYIGDGGWGDGRPDLNIFHKRLNQEEKIQVNNNLTRFTELLKQKSLNMQ